MDRYVIIYVEADNICHVTIIHFVQKFLGSTESFLIYTYGFVQCHDWSNSMGPIRLCCNYVIHSIHKEITLYTGNFNLTL